MSEEDKVLHAQFEGMKDLINEKLNNVCKEISGMNKTLTDHNGRLGRVERIIEQGKGASKVVGGFWGVVGGGVVALVVAFLRDKF